MSYNKNKEICVFYIQVIPDWISFYTFVAKINP